MLDFPPSPVYPLGPSALGLGALGVKTMGPWALGPGPLAERQGALGPRANHCFGEEWAWSHGPLGVWLEDKGPEAPGPWGPWALGRLVWARGALGL